MNGLIIVAGGSGNRYGGNKLWEKLGVMPVFLCSMAELGGDFLPENRVLVTAAETENIYRELAERFLPDMPFRIVRGGERRIDSVRNGLHALSPELECVAIHDAARPLAKRELLRAVMQCAAETGGAVPGRAVTDTLKRCDAAGRITATVPRDLLYRVETPQCFRLKLLLTAYELCSGAPTDDAGVMEEAGFAVEVVAHNDENIKITYRSDLQYIKWLLESANE